MKPQSSDRRPSRKPTSSSAPKRKSRPASGDAGGIRLQRILAMAGVGSRRHCEEYILTGRVTVDGKTVQELGSRVDPDAHDVRLDGERLRVERPVHYLVHKPAGVLCTNRDPRGRPRVVDLCPQGRERLFTVGRLDENSTGLILVTNDGELAHRLAHPRFRVRKVYQVQTAGVPSREILEQLQSGVYFAEGRFKVAEAKFLKAQGESALLEIVLTEGQNREIRRLLARLGHKVQRLKRMALGDVQLGALPVGQFRPLTGEEIASLRELAFAGGSQGGARGRKQGGAPRRGESRGKGSSRDRRPSGKGAARGKRPARRG